MSDQEHDEDDNGINPEEVVRVIELNEGENDYADSDDDEDKNEEMDMDEASGEPVQDDSTLTFGGHRTSPVICTRLNPVNPDMAVTGGEDDRAFVWSTSDGSVLFECTGHTDTVIGVGFSFDGSLVVSADMKGFIQVWRVDSASQVWSFEAPEIEWIQWHQAAPVLLAGTDDGQVWMWKIPSGDLKTFTGHGPRAWSGTILPDGKHACVGYGDGVLKIWDLKSSQAVHTVSGHDAHKEAVYCLDHNINGSLIISGACDMTAKITNVANGKVVSTLCPKQKEEEDSIEAVAFSKTHDYGVTGTLGGSLQVWDLPTKAVRQECDHPRGVVKIRWSPSGSTFYTACLDGNLRQFDSRNGQVVRTWHGHTAGIMDFDVASNESILVTASEDSTAKVFSHTTTGR